MAGWCQLAGTCFFGCQLHINKVQGLASANLMDVRGSCLHAYADRTKQLAKASWPQLRVEPELQSTRLHDCRTACPWKLAFAKDNGCVWSPCAYLLNSEQPALEELNMDHISYHRVEPGNIQHTVVLAWPSWEQLHLSECAFWA